MLRLPGTDDNVSSCLLRSFPTTPALGWVPGPGAEWGDGASAPQSAASGWSQAASFLLLNTVAYLRFHIITIFLTAAFAFLAVDDFEIWYRFCIEKYPTLALECRPISKQHRPLLCTCHMESSPGQLPHVGCWGQGRGQSTVAPDSMIHTSNSPSGFAEGCHRSLQWEQGPMCFLLSQPMDLSEIILVKSCLSFHSSLTL